MKKKIINAIVIGAISIVIISLYLFWPYIFAGKYTNKTESFIIHSNSQLTDNDITFFKQLKNKEILNNDYVYNIFLTPNKNIYIILTLVNYRAFGITNRITGNIIIAPSDIVKNVVKRNGKTNNIRKLSSVILHECTHKYLNKKYGIIKMTFTKTWKEEGYCEYISQGSSFGFSRGIDLFMQSKEDNSGAFDYFKYRLYVQYLIDYKKMTFDEILDKRFELDNLEEEIRNNIKDSLYIPPKK